MPGRAHLVIWAQARHATLLREVIDRADLALAVVAGPEPSDAAELSRALDAPRADDLRQALQHEGMDLAWLIAPVAAADLQRWGRDLRGRILTSEPLPGSLADLPAETVDAIPFIPLMRHGPGFRAAHDLIEEIGPVRCVETLLLGGPSHGSLFARLFDAMDLLERFGIDVETIDAALAGPLPTTPESLRGLQGHLTANVRGTDRRSAAVTVSDRAAGWRRRVTLLGEGGCLTITDGGFRWQGADGTVDEHTEESPLTYEQLVADQMRRLLDPRQPPEPPPETVQLLALCETAWLSCRTGQGESPRRMREMRLGR